LLFLYPQGLSQTTLRLEDDFTGRQTHNLRYAHKIAVLGFLYPQGLSQTTLRQADDLPKQQYAQFVLFA
jgi:hypothetical protein